MTEEAKSDVSHKVKMKSFIKALPKVELHAHINGSVSEATMKKLIQLKRDRLGPGQVTDEQATSPYKRGYVQPLEACFAMFKWIYTFSDSVEAAYVVTMDVIEEFAVDNVKYLELRSTPRSVPETNMTKRKYIESVLKAIRDSQEKNLDIQVRLLLAIDRRWKLEEAWETLALAEEYRESSHGVVVGLDLSGDPKVGDGSMFVPVFREAHKKGLKFTLHLAEVPNMDEETWSLLQTSPDRIGHGICLRSPLANREDIAEHVEKHKVPIELCLSSNIKVEAVPSLDNHHFCSWYERHHPVAFCTDDKGVFATSLSEEYSLAAEAFNLNAEQLWQMSYQAIDFIFAGDDIKQQLRQKWNKSKDGVFSELTETGMKEDIASTKN